jgi:hypothetical protein
LLLLALTLTGALALPVVASAADLTNAGGTLIYTGTDADGYVAFDTTGTPGQVEVDGTGAADLITTSNCTPSAGTYLCDGVTGIVANGNGGDDSLYVYPGGLTQPMTFDGGSGDDGVVTGDGNDVVRGGPGEDGVNGNAGNDDIFGGSGIDSTFVSRSADPAPAVNGSLDDQANDGGPGETDNIHSDVEDVTGQSFSTGPGASDGIVTLRGNAGSNSLQIYSGRGNLDGGPGNDVVAGAFLDDTINSVDGFADRVTCGAGTDTVTADTLDTVGDNCENVTRTDAGNANQDKQPTVSWSAPASNATLSATKANTLAVNASDDKGVAKVQFLAGSRIVCEDTTAPYSCAYKPNGADSGKQVLTAIAIDSAQQTATAIRAVKIGRFAPRISEKVSPSKDTKAPYRFRVTGTLTPPTGMSKSEACGVGVISTSVKAGTKTISTRRVNLKSNCTYSSTVSFASRSRFGRARSLKLTVRFGGNSVLATRTLTSKTVRIR